MSNVLLLSYTRIEALVDGIESFLGACLELPELLWQFQNILRQELTPRGSFELFVRAQSADEVISCFDNQ